MRPIKTYLYYNPLATTQSVAINLGAGSQFDLYDAVSNQYLARGRSGQTFFNVPSDEAVLLVLVPSGGTETRQGRSSLVNGVVIDYNATLLPNNLIRNPDVDTALGERRQSSRLLALQHERDMVVAASAKSHPFARIGRQQRDQLPKSGAPTRPALRAGTNRNSYCAGFGSTPLPQAIRSEPGCDFRTIK